MNYISRCIKTLKTMTAPLHHWYCTEVIDVKEDNPTAPLAECELCGCKYVRFLHVMEHREFFIPLQVGCSCAETMEDDCLHAKERERVIRNRAERRERFLRKTWKQPRPGFYFRRHKKQDMQIIELNGGYKVCAAGKSVIEYRGQPITDMHTAKRAAFALVDVL